MKWKFCGGRDESEIGLGQLGIEIKSVGIGIISVHVQVSSVDCVDSGIVLCVEWDVNEDSRLTLVSLCLVKRQVMFCELHVLIAKHMLINSCCCE